MLPLLLSSIPPCCSYIREIWMLTRTGLATLQGESDATPNEHTLGSNGGKRPYTLFQGHSGPVYSATFSPLGDFILSSSSDSTGKLIYFAIYHHILSTLLVFSCLDILWY